MRVFFKLLLIVLIIGSGAVITQKLIHSKPKAKKTPVSLGAPAVNVITVNPKNETIYVSATGTVIPENELILVPQVSGQIIKAHTKMIPGEHFNEGETLFKIDDKDYIIASEQKKAMVVSAEMDLKMENARQVIAEREWSLLNSGDKPLKIKSNNGAQELGKELALRKPQLASYEAALKAAKSALEKSELDVMRTLITCPFNAILLEKYVTSGQYVTPGTKLIRIAGIDRYWVRVSVPVEKLPYIHIPGVNAPDGNGSIVRISSETDIQDADDNMDQKTYRTGKVIRLEGELESKSRMARILISVEDPLMLKTKPINGERPLLLGAYVNVSIEGDVLDDVYAVPRQAITSDGEVYLSVVKDESENNDEKPAAIDPILDIVKVDELWRKKDEIIVKGLTPGARVVITRIPAPVPGMELKVINQDD